MKLSCRAGGKLNLTMDVLGKRDDGYHNISSVMQTVSLADEISIDTGAAYWRLTSQDLQVPTDDSNLALKAAKLFASEIGMNSSMSIHIDKRIPMCAGLGGGSADCGAVLSCLNEAYGSPLGENKLIALALSLGSDVPFCLKGGRALAEGRGEILTPVSSELSFWIVLCKPGFDLTAGEMYRRLDSRAIPRRPDNKAMIQALEAGRLTEAASLCTNVFYPIVAEEHPEVIEIKNLMTEALSVSMTGKGPTMFGIYADKAAAQRDAEALSGKFSQTFLCRTE